MRRNCKSEPHEHATRIAFNRRVEELFHAGKIDDGVELLLDFAASHAQNRAVKKNVFASGQFEVKTGANFQQRTDAPEQIDVAARGPRDVGQNFKQRRFSCPVAPDDADHIAVRDVKIHIFQSPERFARRLLKRPAHLLQQRLADGGLLFLLAQRVGFGNSPHRDSDIFR